MHPKRTSGPSTEIAITEAASRLGLELDADRHAACPLHQGPGFEIDPVANTWRCSTCDLEGGVLDLVVRVLGVSARHAQALLGGDLASIPKPSKVGTITTKRFLGADFDPDDDNQVLLGKVVDFYNSTLKNNDEALTYLDKRGIGESSLIDRFRLGVANRTLGYRLPKANRKAGAAIRSRLRDLGVLRSSGHEHFNGSLIVPITDTNGDIVQVYGRKVGERLRAGTELHLWLPERPVALFNSMAFEAEEVIITDSVINALSFLANGFEHVVGLPVIDAETDEMILAALHGGTTKKVTLAFQRTEEGEQAAERMVKVIANLGVEVHRVTFPMAMDANAFITSAENPTEALASLMRGTEWTAGKPSKLNAPVTTATTETMDVPPPEPAIEGDTDELVMIYEDRRWRIRGLNDNKARGTLKLNVFVSRDNIGFHVDRFDLYSARHRAAFVRQAATELGLDEGIIKKDLGTVLLAAEQAQDELLRRHRAPEPVTVEMTLDEREEALRLLQDPNLLNTIKEDFVTLGIVGEGDNLLLAYLITVSRKLQQPLAAIVQSSSAAGKSSLVNAALALVPDEDKHTFSAMTGQSLFYVGGSKLKHKVLSIAEEEGATRAAYSLKLLQSEGSLTIASTGKEPGSGRLVSQEYRVEGPVAIMMTTTEVEVDDELLNRCLVLTVDESPEQTARIHARQRHQMTLQGLLADEARANIIGIHKNAQRLLRPIKVVLPETESLSFPDLRVRARRDHRKLLGLVEVVALLHQHHRERKTIVREGAVIEFIEATKADIEVARQLLDHVGGAGVDDLPPATRKLLVQLDRFASDQAAHENKDRPEIRFSRRQVREALGLGDTQAKVHLRRLVDSEFILAHRAPHGRGVIYSLAFNGHGYDDQRSADGRPSVGPRSAQGRGEVAARSEGATPAKEATKSKRGMEPSRKRSIGASQKSRTVGSSPRKKRGRR